MSANAGSRNSSNQSLTKLALAVRVLGKELRRLKLKRMDLARADLRLGEKAYATGIADGQAELVSKLDGVAQRVTQLRQQEAEATNTDTAWDTRTAAYAAASDRPKASAHLLDWRRTFQKPGSALQPFHTRAYA